MATGDWKPSYVDGSSEWILYYLNALDSITLLGSTKYKHCSDLHLSRLRRRIYNIEWDQEDRPDHQEDRSDHQEDCQDHQVVGVLRHLSGHQDLRVLLHRRLLGRPDSWVVSMMLLPRGTYLTIFIIFLYYWSDKKCILFSWYMGFLISCKYHFLMFFGRIILQRKCRPNILISNRNSK